LAVNQDIEQRIQRARQTLAQQDLDTFLVLIGENRFYLSGFSAEDTQFDESAGALLITGEHLLLLTDSRYDQQAATEAPLYEVICYKEGLKKVLPDVLKRVATRRLGFESVRISVKQHEEFCQALGSAGIQLEMVATENIVEDLRAIKSQHEIEQTRQALALAEMAFQQVTRTISSDMTEQQAAWALERAVREAGAQGLSFPSIIASGPNSALPHAVPSDRRLQEGEPIIFDWGAKLNHYCSDISRTLVLGKPNEMFQRVFQTVLEAQKKAIGAIKAGASAKAVDKLARDHIDAMGFQGRFGHGLGHGTGLAVHEAPRLSPVRDDVLKAGMIVTVEPGIYIPGWGGVRIENQVVVRDHGAEVLNASEAGRFWIER
jgi:Xaa-Pro aminopeptidase